MSEDLPEVDAWRIQSITMRSRTIEAIAPTDRIEVYLLDPVQEPGDLGDFPLRPYGPRKSTGIHEVKSLEGEPADQLLALWTDTVRDDEGLQASCHYPIHGLRFYCEQTVLYETSICWVCNNYYGGTEQGYRWLGLPGEYPKGPVTPSCAQLRQQLESLLPIPNWLKEKVSIGGTRREYGGGRRYR